MIKNRSSKIGLVMIVIVSLSMLSAGCGKKLTETDVPYAKPMLDNILAGIAEKDYSKFSKDFSEPMKTGIQEDDFHAMVTTLESKLGEYESRSFTNATQIKSATELMLVTYEAEYSKESNVTMKIYFSDSEGKKSIEGFSIDAPALQQ